MSTKLITFECPACASEYRLPVGAKTTCERCEDEIREVHRLRPQVELIAFRKKWRAAVKKSRPLR